MPSCSAANRVISLMTDSVNTPTRAAVSMRGFPSLR
jgi:hypothetical protein